MGKKRESNFMQKKRPDWKDYPSDSAGIRAEEESHLQSVLTWISQKIQQLRQAIPFRGISRYATAIDKEDRRDLQSKKERNDRIDEKIVDLQRSQKEPYFARMDLLHEDNIGNGVETLYIGEREISLNGQSPVHDWRSPIGQYYYMKRETRFRYNEYSYRLFLRRGFRIQNGRLNDIYEEYFDPSVLESSPDAGQTNKQKVTSPPPRSSAPRETGKTDSIAAPQARVKQTAPDTLLPNTITDPFLREVLRERRGNPQMTNIIRTIQENQNQIIRAAINQNLIVQGCAGSGKTMILLHRLSYLKFNNKGLDLSRIKIITPNRLFDMHVDNLSRELGVGRIRRLTMEEYYCQLLSLYGTQWQQSPDKVLSESGMDAKCIRVLYSTEFAEDMQEEFSKWQTELVELYNGELSRLGAKYHIKLIPWPEKAITPLEVLKAFRAAVVQLREKIGGIASKQKQCEETAAALETSLKKKIETTAQSYAERKMEEIGNIRAGIARNEQLLFQKHAVQSSILGRLLHQKQGEEAEAQTLEEDTLKREIEAGNARIQQAKENLDALETAFENLESSRAKEDMNDNANGLPGQRSLFSDDDITEYDSAVERFLQLIKDEDAEHIWYSILRNRKELETLKEQNIPKEIKENIKRLASMERNAVPKLVFSRIFQACLEKQLEASEIKETDNVTRARLYSILRFCYLLYGKVVRPDTILCIDEGQDISLSEYLLLQAVNSGVVINTYGDLNQRINANRGIDQWNDLQEACHAKVYDLNENYRNSIEINQYCNKIFQIASTSIGLSYGPVMPVKPQTMMHYMRKALEENPNVAVIGKNMEKLQAVERVAAKQEISTVFGTVTAGQIAVLTVEQVKGLEFHTVFVIPDGMTRNEQYVSFTRALNRLYVING